MKMCQEHWDALRKSLADRELDKLGPQTAEELSASMQRQVDGKATNDDFSPLMNAHTAIISAYLHTVGMEAFEGEKCPLCEADKHANLAANWIAGACDDQLAAAREMGLVSQVQ
jgi:hypothetical protein